MNMRTDPPDDNIRNYIAAYELWRTEIRIKFSQGWQDLHPDPKHFLFRRIYVENPIPVTITEVRPTIYDGELAFRIVLTFGRIDIELSKLGEDIINDLPSPGLPWYLGGFVLNPFIALAWDGLTALAGHLLGDELGDVHTDWVGNNLELLVSVGSVRQFNDKIDDHCSGAGERIVGERYDHGDGPPAFKLRTADLTLRLRSDSSSYAAKIPLLVNGLIPLADELLRSSSNARESATNLLGWLLGDRDRRLHGARQTLSIGYVGDAPRSLPPLMAAPQRTSPEPAPLEQGNLAKIDHIIVLMMENRSFDHMLGYLSLPVDRGGKNRAEVDGLRISDSNPMGSEFSVDAHRLESTVFVVDPGHDFVNIDRQRHPTREQDPSSEPDNQGFIKDFELQVEKFGELLEASGLRLADRVGAGKTGADIMGYYTGDQVFAYDRLAREYAVCDKWFAAVPGQTWPNRFVTQTGQLQRDANDRPMLGNPDLGSFDPQETLTIFDHLTAAGVEWRYYEHDFSFLRLFSKYTFDRDRIVPIDDPVRGFFAAAAAGDFDSGGLPPVTFIEPNLTDIPPCNDDHPPCDIIHGQELIRQITDAVERSPVFGKTMLIITYDEHGGFYDHVVPEGLDIFDPGGDESQSPDNTIVPLAIDPNGDRINYYGMRVPTIIVSPLVPRGHVSKDLFDHTSILKTIIKRFLTGAPPDMGARVAFANDLGSMLTETRPRVVAPGPAVLTPATHTPTVGGSNDSRIMLTELRTRFSPRRR